MTSASFRRAACALLLVLATASAAQAQLANDAERLFNWAEQRFQLFLPSHQVTQAAGEWLFRHYPELGVYLGVNANDTGVWVLGGPWGAGPVRLGALAAFVAQIEPPDTSNNVVAPDATFAVILGGQDNAISAAGDWSAAGGRRAKVNHAGSFVWADSLNADFTSTADNQFRIRAANGLSLAVDGGGTNTHPVGTYFRDNSIVAWGRVTAAGGLDSNFNVATITRVSVGVYRVTLKTSVGSGFSMVATVTPEIDNVATDVPPTGAAAVRIAAVDNFAAGNVFNVYMYNGSFALVDNDFVFQVTGR